MAFLPLLQPFRRVRAVSMRQLANHKFKNMFKNSFMASILGKRLSERFFNIKILFRGFDSRLFARGIACLSVLFRFLIR